MDWLYSKSLAKNSKSLAKNYFLSMKSLCLEKDRRERYK